MKLLLVDDEPLNIELLRGIFTPLGHELLTAADGHAALRCVQQERVDLLILDVRMPGMDGFDVLAHIRADPNLRFLPVIVVTAYAERGDRLRALEAGADDFVEKPLEAAVLLARARTLLSLKRARDDLTARNARLEALQREQCELAQFIVHDLKNPLAVIDTNAAWIREELGGADLAIVAALDDTKTAVDRMSNLIDDILSVAKLEERALELRREPVDLARLCRELVQAHTREAASRSLSLRADARSQVTALADPRLITRVVENLLENSLRYTPSGGRISVRAEQGNGAEIEVCNDGAPIPPQVRERVFEKFVRGSRPPIKAHFGLGLYFCKRAIEAHRGSIELRETDTWPISFRVCLPDN